MLRRALMPEYRIGCVGSISVRDGPTILGGCPALSVELVSATGYDHHRTRHPVLSLSARLANSLFARTPRDSSEDALRTCLIEHRPLAHTQHPISPPHLHLAGVCVQR